MTTIIAQDTFATRTITGSSTISFGTASDGEAWQAPLWGTLLTTGVSGGEGYLMSSSGGAAAGTAFLGKGALRDVDITCRFKFGTVTGNPLFQLCFRGKDTNNYTDIAINATAGALTLERWSSGNNASFSMGAFGALTASTFYRIRIQSDGSTIRAKVWLDGTGEPGSFAYTASDTFLASQIAGFFGVGITNVVATTQANSVQFDSLVVSTVYDNQQLYVATTGNDTTGNGSSGSPYLTLQRGFDAISPGGTLHVAPGVYAQASGVILLGRASGTAANRITLQSDVKWGAKITGTNVFSIFEVDGSYVDVLGFDVSATDAVCAYGIVMKGNFCSVQRCYGHDIQAVSATIYGGAAISGQNSGNNYVSGPVDVIGNFVTRIGVDGTDANNSGGYVHAIYMSQQGGLVQNNIVVGNASNAYQGGHGASGQIITNNTFVGNKGGGVFIWSGYPTEGPGPNDFTTIANNLIAFNTGSIHQSPVLGLQEYGANVGPHNTYANNLLFGNATSTNAPYVGLQYEFFSGYTPTNFLFTTPQMVNYQQNGSGDYHLQPTSPCIDAGIITNASTTDYDEVLRPLGIGYDIGAYEYFATGVILGQPGALTASTDTAMLLNGVNSSIQFPPAVNTANWSALTASIWINPSNILFSQTAWLIGNDDPSMNNLGFALAVTKNAVVFRIGTGSTYYEINQAFTFVASTWYRVTGVFSGTSLKVYMNGSQIATLTVTAALIAQTTNQVLIGAKPGSTANNFPGAVQAASLYNTALSAAQELALYTAGNNPS